MIALVAQAWCADLTESNISATTVGFQLWHSTAQREIEGAKSSDFDILLGQRLRWTLVQTDSFALRARVHARFTLSPGEDNFFKRNRVRKLGLSLLTPKFTLDVGRHPVYKGGPRLVDGVQFVFHPSKVLDVGFWGGLLPNLFTTDPAFDPLRFGGGPIVGLNMSRVQASVAGEIAVAGGGVDRMAVLLQARASAARTIEVSGRADLEIIGQDGFRLSDAQVFGRWSPIRSMRLDVTYNVFGSYTYQNTQALDPDLTRFQERYITDANGLPQLVQNCLEPNTAHMVGAGYRFHPKNEGIAPMAGLTGRFRFGGDADEIDPAVPDACILDDVNQFVRVHPSLGVTGLPVAGRLDVTLDANYYSIEGRAQMDAGLAAFWEPGDTGVFAIDASYRLLLNGYDGVKNPYGYQPYEKPGEAAIGHYADLFLDVVVPPTGTSIGAGLNIVSEPGDLAEDLGIGLFARITQYIRSKKKKKSG